MRRWLALVLAALLCLLGCSCRTEPDAEVLFYFFDVGQGDCTLIRTKDGDILIDAGTEDAEQLLCLRLEQLGVTELALAVFTHPDEDHIGGADGVLSQFPAREVWLNGGSMESIAGTLLLQAAERRDSDVAVVMAGRLWSLGDLQLTVLYPDGSLGDGGNEDSIVLRVAFGETVAIFSGDAGAEQEQRMLKRFGEAHLDCDLYKVGHHGSNTSSSKVFLEAMTPEYAVISCGVGNSFGHPTGEVLSRLEAVGADVKRTDLLGEILFACDGEQLWILDE